jgi:hypothetical protein
MGSGQEIKLGVETGKSKADVDAVADALDDLGKSASDAGENLVSLQTTLNQFLTARGKLAGKSPRLYDAKADKAELEDFLHAFQETVKASPNVRHAIQNAQSSAGLPAPAVPGQINMQGISATQAGQAKFFENLMMRMFSHVAAHGKSQLNTGLTYMELTGRSDPRSAPGEPAQQPRPQMPPDSPFGKAAHQAVRGLHSAGTAGGLAASAIEGAAAASGSGAMGMLKGGGIAALAYGAYKTVSAAGGAVMDKLDAGKTENIEIDKFKRAVGSTADSFADLKNKSRAVGEQFLLTYEQSRKLTTDFAILSKSNVNGAALAGVGVGLAQSVGVDEGEGSAYMATMRRSGALSEKVADARLLAIQFAEALKRTGSTLNASDLMHSISGFAMSTSQRALLAPNTEGYAGMLSAMVGTGAPGLRGNVGNAAAILGHADAAFQGGGSMGEASKTLQYQALDGNKVGLLGVKMRQAAGMFATGDQVFGNENSQVNKFLGNGGMSRFGGDKSGIESVLSMFAGSGMSKSAQLMAAGNHFQNMNPEQIATLMNLRESGKLTGMTSLMSQHPELKDKFEKMSAFGYESLSSVEAAKGDSTKLAGVRDQLAKREGLTDDQKKELGGMSGLTGKPLQDALVKFTTTLEREKTMGEQAQDSAAKTAQATARMADGLIPAAQSANNLLSALVQILAPTTGEGQRILAEERKKTLQAEQDKLSSGTSNRSIEGIKRDFDSRRSFASGNKEELAKIDLEEKEVLGWMAGGHRSNFGGKDPRIIPSDAESAINRAAAKSGINPDYMRGLAQLETGLGVKTIKSGSDDSRNLFNIKGKTGFQAFDKSEGSRDFYRTYGSYDESADDLASLLSRKYPSAAQAKTPREFAEGLKKGGYATDPNYVDKLVGAIGTPAQIPGGNPADRSGSAQPSNVAFNSPTANIVVRVESADGLRAQTQEAPSSVVFKPRPSGSNSWSGRIQ